MQMEVIMAMEVAAAAEAARQAVAEVEAKALKVPLKCVATSSIRKLQTFETCFHCLVQLVKDCLNYN